MLYGIGIMLLLLSVGFVGGSAAVPIAVASIGIALMMAGKKERNHETE